ncbi:MAG: DUF3301 domain-containing protein [Gammaproteobacteria bacterium]|nr:DUF3301 domain-containing protein [Gammaproteobacteria bacterium]MDH5727904.1 DUF3301 domain-containing protein [Gammaproteobacteria bacterium]
MNEQSQLLVFFLAFAVAAYFWFNRQAQEFARIAARRICKNHQLQLLDESVAMTRFRLQRNSHGRLQLIRHFNFEFTSFDNIRHAGEISLFGRQVQSYFLDLPPEDNETMDENHHIP